MSAFAIEYSGPAVPCDFPGCLLDSFHIGDHQFRSAEENSARLAAAVTSYGVGTKSYNSSAEKRELTRQQKEVTARYQMMPRQEIEVPLSCRCPQRPYPHELSVHSLLRREKPGSYIVWAGRKSDSFSDELVTFSSDEMRWPWSLCLSRREEPRTERKVT